MEEAKRARVVLASLPEASAGRGGSGDKEREEEEEAEAEWRLRASSFRTELWPLLSPASGVVAALCGWRCERANEAQCEQCRAVLRALHPLLPRLLLSAHTELCVWRVRCVDPFAALVPGASSLVRGVHARLASLDPAALCARPFEGLGQVLGTSDSRASLAVAGWRQVAPQIEMQMQMQSHTETVVVRCELCTRTALATQDLDVVTAHRVFCPFRRSRSHLSRMAAAFSQRDFATVSDLELSKDERPSTAQWTANLLLGLPDIDPQL